MPLEHSILNLDDFELENISGKNPLVFRLRYLPRPNCPGCGEATSRIKDTFYRWIRHESFGTRKVLLHLRAHKYQCQSCKRYFNSRFPGILPYHRTTEAFKRKVEPLHLESEFRDQKSSKENVEKVMRGSSK